MSDPVACALISLAGVVSSGALSLLIARVTSTKEAAKLRLQWSRDDVVSGDNAFSEMARAVVLFTYSPDNVEKRAAASCAVSAVLATQTGKLGDCLDVLCAHIDNGDSVDSIRNALYFCVEQKRKQICERDRH